MGASAIAQAAAPGIGPLSPTLSRKRRGSESHQKQVFFQIKIAANALWTGAGSYYLESAQCLCADHQNGYTHLFLLFAPSM